MSKAKSLWFWDAEQPVYDHGLPFSEKHAENLDDMMDRIQKGFAALVVFSGGMGQGKTTLACLSAEYVQKGPVVFKEQLAMGGEEFIHKLKVCFAKGYVVVIYDESGDFSRRSTLTKLNRLLKRVFETYRAFKILVFLSVPNAAVLDKGLFDDQVVRMGVLCLGRTQRQGSFSAYSLWRLFYVFEKMKKLTVKPEAWKFVQPNYRGHFLNYSPRRSAELDQFSTKGKLEIGDMVEIKSQNLLNYKEIAGRVGMSLIWVRTRMNKIGIRAAKTYKGKKLFDGEIVHQLEALKKR